MWCYSNECTPSTRTHGWCPRTLGESRASTSSRCGHSGPFLCKQAASAFIIDGYTSRSRRLYDTTSLFPILHCALVSLFSPCCFLIPPPHPCPCPGRIFLAFCAGTLCRASAGGRPKLSTWLPHLTRTRNCNRLAIEGWRPVHSVFEIQLFASTCLPSVPPPLRLFPHICLYIYHVRCTDVSVSKNFTHHCARANSYFDQLYTPLPTHPQPKVFLEYQHHEQGRRTQPADVSARARPISGRGCLRRRAGDVMHLCVPRADFCGSKPDWDTALEVKDTLLVLDCFATWCGPCKVIAPQVVK